MAGLIESIPQFVTRITEVALHDPPISLLLVGLGGLLIGASSAAVGYLALGAVVDLVTPDLGGARSRQAR